MDVFWTAILAAIVWSVYKLSTIGSREPGLPPGPPTTPILGNLGIFPKTYAYLKLTEWARRWGKIYSLKLGPMPAIVITDATAIKEFMDRRGHTTSDRPPNFVLESVSGGLDLAIAHYGDKWKTLRKASHAILTPHMLMKQLPIQYAESSQLLFDILRTPGSFDNHIRRYANSVIMSVAFGKRCPRYETPETTAMFTAVHEYEMLLEPGATPPVDFLPFLKWVPERWAKWKTEVKQCRKHQMDLYFGLLDETIKRMERGEENGCQMEELIMRQEELGLNREMVGRLGGALLQGGSDTFTGFLRSVVLMMIAFPESQKKAQAELDRVVGPHRLPTLEDLPDLPYIRAIIQEVNRFRPPVPLIPHATSALEEYRGFLIPKGTAIFVNVWGMFHDPDMYDHPDTFDPDRYLLTENGTKPGVDGSDSRTNLIYGCSRNLNTMRLLWAFDFSRATDSTGSFIDVDVDAYENGMLSHPAPFKASIKPRSPETLEIIEQEFDAATETFSKFEIGLSHDDRVFLERYRSNEYQVGL
ncbi:hypothetical protein PQX77_006555 [Marasmius sp. AFHP31]|nr:hypothetical protein PQX77_006555 [Marasmius sp. AFHP31]